MLGFAGCLVGCDRSPAPRDFRLELPAAITSTDPATVVVRATRADGVNETLSTELDFSVQPPNLAQVSRRGILLCQRSGDGTVSLTLGGTTRSTPVRCRLVERIEADTENVDIGAGPFSPKVAVLGKGGTAIGDVDVSFSSKTPGVLVAQNKQLLPKNVGTARVVARAGQASREFTVNVVRRLSPEALPLDANRRIHHSLEAGKYRLTAKLGEARRFSVEWRGAPYCNYSATAREHESTCVLRTKGGVVFDNPGYTSAAGAKSPLSLEGVTLAEVP